MRTFKYIKRLAGETAIYGASGIITRLIGILLIPIYTRIFSPAEYGVMSLIYTLVNLFTIFVVLGLDNSSARWFYDTQDIKHQKSIISSWFWCQFFVSGVATFILFILAPQFSLLLFRSEKYILLIRLVAPVIFFGTFGKVLGNLLRYQHRTWTTAIFSTTTVIMSVGLAILFVVTYRWRLTGVFSAHLLTSGIVSVIAVFILKAWISPINFSMARLKDMLVYSLPLVPASIASWIKLSSDRFILQIFWQESEVGLYSIASSLAYGVGLLTLAFQLAWGPFAYSILHDEHSAQVYAEVLDIYIFLGTLLCIGVSIFSTLILAVLTTGKYLPAASCVPFIAFAFIFNGALYIAAFGSNIAKKSIPVATSIFISAAVNIILNFILIPYFGKEGAAFSTMISALLGVVYLFPISQKIYYIPYRFRMTIICLAVSWLFIVIERFFFPSSGVIAFVLRAVMVLLFIPIPIAAGLVSPYHLKRFLYRRG